METPTRISSHASSSICSPDDHERDDEISLSADKNEDKTHGVEMASSESYDDEDGRLEDGSVNFDLPTVSMECQEEFLKDILDNASGSFPDFSFVMSRVRMNGTELPVLMITPVKVFNHPPLGIMARVQVVVHYKFYTVHVLMRLWKQEHFDTVEEITNLCSMIGEKSQYKFCPGLPYENYMENYYEVIRFHIKSVRQTNFPFKRIDSRNCKLLFKLAHNATIEEKFSTEVKCSPCKRLVTDLERQKRRTGAETPTRHTKRQRPSSRARTSYMSPASKAKRRKLAQYERTNNIRKLARYEEHDIVLDNEQSDEMYGIVKEMGEEELQKLYDEGDKHNVGAILKDIWTTDLDRQQKQFSDDQATNCNLITILKYFDSLFFVTGNGGRGNRWSMITIRMGKYMHLLSFWFIMNSVALAIYCRSPAAYKALKDFNILSLPAKSTLQSYSGAFIHAAGVSSACIAGQVSRYVLFKEQCRLAGKQEPRGDGALIFDEVKVACQLMWNSRNNKLMGLAMTSTDLISLNDIYLLLQRSEGSKQTSYVLQFLWRDLTSSFDIIGPYFTSASTVDSKFVMACVLETVKLFQCHGLKTSVLMCDGGSSNVATIKACHDHHGAYAVTDGEDKFAVKPWMINPFNPPHRIYWLICPSHQVCKLCTCMCLHGLVFTPVKEHGQCPVLIEDRWF